ncbi:hypothetical protein CAPTEDRAFT_192020 [Capitella teleta]|uniref:G-protein coupled receptors family 1 profile domain-containing protein n=1 Tax=Capitella teleta TaxID=283909 RepID=R7TAU1_CAPTE|nr:hypothetical protein CAPTEDRAFT_192020 [Capitella teleta]|eukprot:ELT90632.1 hypothetical protein CAPTEDRAFT_192020 [Capitella teleta]
MATVSPQDYSTESDNEVAIEKELDLSQFDSCILYYFIAGSCFGGFLILIGLVGNGITIVIMGKERKKSATINCLFMLAIADTLVLLTYGFILVPLGIRKYFYGWWNGHNYNHVTIIYVVEAARIFSQVSAFITMLVTFQRYVSVCQPHRAKQLCSVRLVNQLTVVSYVVSIIFFLPNFFTYYLEMNNDTHRYLTVSKPLVLSPAFKILYSSIASVIVTYIIPIASLSFMSIQILRAMSAQSKVMQQSHERSQARKDLTLSSVAIVGLFIICQSFNSANRVLMWVYEPYAANARCGGVLQYIFMVPYLSMIMNSAANFGIYVVLAKGFRKKVIRLFVGQNRVAPQDSTEMIGDTVAGPSMAPTKKTTSE